LGTLITLLAGVIVLGSLKRIARFAELIVPFMGIVLFWWR
jgi:AGCS family alanine or glycine:cation symporter